MLNYDLDIFVAHSWAFVLQDPEHLHVLLGRDVVQRPDVLACLDVNPPVFDEQLEESSRNPPVEHRLRPEILIGSIFQPVKSPRVVQDSEADDGDRADCVHEGEA